MALPDEIEYWSLTTLREKLVKIGAKVVSQGWYVTFQMAEVAVPRGLFREILRLIDKFGSDHQHDAEPAKGYASTLSDAQFALIAPLLPPPKGKGRPRTTNMRAVLDAIFYRQVWRIRGCLEVHSALNCQCAGVNYRPRQQSGEISHQIACTSRDRSDWVISWSGVCRD